MLGRVAFVVHPARQVVLVVRGDRVVEPAGAQVITAAGGVGGFGWVVGSCLRAGCRSLSMWPGACGVTPVRMKL